jgi:hypothetical protein
MNARMDVRVVALASLAVVSYGVGFFRGNDRLALVMEAAHVASDMSGSWERNDTGAVHVLVPHYAHHAWYVLVGSYVDPRNAVQARLGSQVARQIRGHGDERDWVLYTVLDDGTVLPAVDIWMESFERGIILGSHDVVVVKNTTGSGHERLEVVPTQSAGAHWRPQAVNNAALLDVDAR